jgi:hypothetical protein
MNTDHTYTPAPIRNGAGQLISDRRARPRAATRGRSTAVMSNIARALRDTQLTRDNGGFDPYDHHQRHKGGDVWGSKRRD